MAINHSHIIYKTAGTDIEFGLAKDLFLEYASSLPIDLSFQDFDNELQTISLQYNKPQGALLLAFHHEQPIACAGIRLLDHETAELKRMYVQPAFRKHRIGQALLEQAIETARDLGYKTMRLDTLPDMLQAQKLYTTYGFHEIPPYRFNPVEGTVYMEKRLS